MKKLLLIFVTLFINALNAQCVQNIALGGAHTVYIKNDGTLWAIGWNEYGQLGDGTYNNKNLPTKIGNDNDWKSVTLGSNLQTLAIKNDGTLWAWGRNANGQLGDGTNIDKNSPTKIGNDNDWKYIVAGRYHSIAIKNDGTLWAWGKNHDGELGDGTNLDRAIPTKIGNDTNWHSIAAGNGYTMALKNDGTLWSCGDDGYNKLGNGDQYSNTNILTQVGNSNDWQSISTRASTSFAIKKNGTLWAWGDDNFGQLGNGVGHLLTYIGVPTQVGNDTNWKKIASGNFNISAIKTDGTLWSWGLNDSGQLGDGTFTDKFIPTQIGSDTNWQSIFAGGGCTGALKLDGTFWAWGLNSAGQIDGNDTTVNINYPIQLNCSTLKNNEFSVDKYYSVYPNPTKELINIKITDNKPISSIKIIDSTGKLILKQTNNFQQINLGHLPKGIYSIQIECDGKTLNQKIIKE